MILILILIMGRDVTDFDFDFDSSRMKQICKTDYDWFLITVFHSGCPKNLQTLMDQSKNPAANIDTAVGWCISATGSIN